MPPRTTNGCSALPRRGLHEVGVGQGLRVRDGAGVGEWAEGREACGLGLGPGLGVSMDARVCGMVANVDLWGGEEGKVRARAVRRHLGTAP